MRTLALDDDGDLELTRGRARWVDGADAVRVRLELRLSLWKGEYILDQGVGVPYADLLGQKGTRELLEATLRQAVATCPGVAALEQFAFEVDSGERRATVSFTARALDGEPVTFDTFRVA